MNILVINAGSSSLKYQLIDMSTEEVKAKGNCERIGLEEGIFSHKTYDGRTITNNKPMKDHIEAFLQVKESLIDKQNGAIASLDEIKAIGHRVVHGGDIFKESTLVNDEVKKHIKDLAVLAPLHNTANLQGIEACEQVFGKDVPQVVVFDTSFHSTMPQKAHVFAVPYKYYEKHNIRRYGFHGTSHRYVSNRCAQLMGKDINDLKIITCHLGNGSSLAAIKNGKVQDTSMGLTPLDGLMMGTRCGTIDPSVVKSIAQIEGISINEVDTILNKKSGLLGISGVSSDDRDITKAEENGNERASLAHDMLRYQITKFIGQYVAVLNGCDAIVFTAGVGENSPSHREAVCENLSYLGVKIDKEKNNELIRGKEGKFSTKDSKVDVFVIPTNEELLIARDTLNISQISNS